MVDNDIVQKTLCDKSNSKGNTNLLKRSSVDIKVTSTRKLVFKIQCDYQRQYFQRKI